MRHQQDWVEPLFPIGREIVDTILATQGLVYETHELAVRRRRERGAPPWALAEFHVFGVGAPARLIVGADFDIDLTAPQAQRMLAEHRGSAVRAGEGTDDVFLPAELDRRGAVVAAHAAMLALHDRNLWSIDDHGAIELTRERLRIWPRNDPAVERDVRDRSAIHDECVRRIREMLH
ncbi:MAG: hypothetical protein HMLKMBBP_00564 [Planctomycetes bacterium]|nr:hypothetical protein [Planctomycetota bacterium]